MLVALIFLFKPYSMGIDYIMEHPNLFFENLNTVLIFMGLGTSFSSLQDTTKTQNNFSKRIWESPTKGKIFIALLCLLILFFLIIGLTGYLTINRGILRNISVGMIVFGLGMFGFLKAAIEMFENHRKDKNVFTHEN